MKPCPKDPNHKVEERSIGVSVKYDLCTVCFEDVDFIAKKMAEEGDNAQVNAAPLAAAPNQNQLEAADADDDMDDDDDQDFDADQDDDHDDDLDDDDVAGPVHFAPPVHHNPHPVRAMGNPLATHQIVLLNNPRTGAHLVSRVLSRVFQKDNTEANYIMMDAHYHDRAVCYYASEQEAEQLMQRIQEVKNEIAAGFDVGANTIGDLQFIVERRPAA